MGLIYVPERKIKATLTPDFPVEVDLEHPLVASASVVDAYYGYYANVSASGINGPLTQFTPNLALLGLNTRGRTVNSVFTANGTLGAAVNYNNLYAGNDPFTVAMEFTVTAISPGGYPAVLVSGGTSDTGISTTTDGTTMSVRYTTSGVFYTEYSTPWPGLNVPISIIYTVVSNTVAPYYGLVVFVNGVQLTSPVLSGGGLGTPQSPQMQFGLWEWNYNNYYGSSLGLNYLVVLQNRLWNNTEILDFRSNPNQILRPRQRALMIPVSSGGAVALDSSTTATGAGSGTVSVEIQIQSASVAVASGTGIVSQSVSFAGSGTATVTGSGDLQIAIPLNASAIATVAGSASMSIAQALAGAGTAAGTGTGTLSASGQMSGSGTAAGTGAATISLSIALSAAAIAQAVGSGQLSLSGSLSGSGTASGIGTGNLTQTIPLVSSSLATVSGTGTMVNSVPLTSSAVVNASGVGMLGVQVGFNAQAFADAIGTGNMSLIIRLSGQAVAQAVASGVLEQSGILQANPRFTINALGRNFTINAL